MRTRTLLLLSLLVTAVVVTIAVVARPPSPDGPTAAPRGEPSSSVRRAIAVLGDWDRRRQQAWAADDGSALRALYVRGSTAGRRDLAMLAAYRRRGLRVTTMERQVLAVRVLGATARRWSLEVIDRLSLARVRGDGASLVLPQGNPATRRIELRRIGSRWRMAAVYEEASPVARTAPTS